MTFVTVPKTENGSSNLPPPISQRERKREKNPARCFLLLFFSKSSDTSTLAFLLFYQPTDKTKVKNKQIKKYTSFLSSEKVI